MANRSLAAKAERAARQAREAAHMEYSKSGYRDARPFEAEGFKHRTMKLAKAPASPFRDRDGFIVARCNGRTVGKAYETVRPARHVTALAAAWATPGEFTLIRNGHIVA